VFVRVEGMVHGFDDLVCFMVIWMDFVPRSDAVGVYEGNVVIYIDK
jgi:hypothetical protein